MEKQIVVYPVVIDTNLTDNYYDVYVPDLVKEFKKLYKGE